MKCLYFSLVLLFSSTLGALSQCLPAAWGIDPSRHSHTQCLGILQAILLADGQTEATNQLLADTDDRTRAFEWFDQQCGYQGGYMGPAREGIGNIALNTGKMTSNALIAQGNESELRELLRVCQAMLQNAVDFVNADNTTPQSAPLREQPVTPQTPDPPAVRETGPERLSWENSAEWCENVSGITTQFQENAGNRFRAPPSSIRFIRSYTRDTQRCYIVVSTTTGTTNCAASSAYRLDDGRILIHVDRFGQVSCGMW